jgi:hypothetical protein
MNKGSKLKIHVVSEEDGTPIKGAKIHSLGGVITVEGSYDKDNADKFTTDKDGYCEIERLPKSKWSISLYHDDFDQREEASITTDGSEREYEVTARMKPYPKLEGTVFSEKDKTPIENAAIFVGYHGEKESARTDSNGKFELKKVSIGSVKLIIVHEDYAIQKGTASISDGANEISIYLQKGSRVKFIVTDKNGNPVKGCRCQIFPGALDMFARTDEKGELIANSIPAGKAIVSVENMGGNFWQEKEIEVLIGKTTEVVFQTGIGVSVRGKATVNEKPYSSAEIRLNSTEPGCWERRVTNNDGMFYFDNIPNGEYEVLISGAGYKFPYKTEKINVNNCDVEVNFSLSFTKIMGTATNEDGNSLYAAEIGLGTSYGESSAIVRTDRDGKYSFENLADGTYYLSASKEGYAVHRKTLKIENADATQIVDFQLNEGVIVSGQITAAGEDALNSIEIFLFDYEDKIVHHELLELATDHSYMLRNLPSGKYNMLALSEGYASAHREVDFTSLEKYDVNFELSKGKMVKMVIKDKNTIPISWAELSLKGEKDLQFLAFENSQVSRLPWISNDEGIIEIHDLNPGKYEFKIEKPGYKSMEITADVNKEDTLIEKVLELEE